MTTEQTWQRRVYERHLDLLLAEELSCNSEFAHWFTKQSVLFGELPDGPLSATLVEVSHDDDINIGNGSRGENDLFMTTTWPNGDQVRILVEDKLDAVVQRDQFIRLRQRAEAHSTADGVVAAGAAVVAPAAYLARRSAELSEVSSISIEDIADELDGQAGRLGESGNDASLAARLRWRSQRLVRLDEGRRSAGVDNQQMIDVRDYIIDRLAATGSTGEPLASSMHTANQGWLYFRDPKAVLYKVAHGTVDIYLRDVWPDDETRQSQAHAEAIGPEGFEATEDTVHNLVFSKRLRPEDEPRWRIAEDDGISDERRRELDAGVKACHDAIAWVRHQVAT
jgi:hypothetical protein